MEVKDFDKKKIQYKNSELVKGFFREFNAISRYG